MEQNRYKKEAFPTQPTETHLSDSLFNHASLVPLTEETALLISEWAYPPPYEVYSFKGHPNGYLFDKSTWGTEQFCLTNDGRILGQVAAQPDGEELWIGWSMEPSLTGKGNGRTFVERCVEELRRVTGHSGPILLRVAASNVRAIRAYQSAGFVYEETIKDEIAYTGHTEDFFILRKAAH